METIIKELTGLVRGAISSWSGTVRLCLVLLAVATAAGAVSLVLG